MAIASYAVLSGEWATERAVYLIDSLTLELEYWDRLLELMGGLALLDMAAGCTAFVEEATDSSQKRCSDAAALLWMTFWIVDVIDLVVSMAGSTVDC